MMAFAVLARSSVASGGMWLDCEGETRQDRMATRISRLDSDDV